MVVTYLRRIFHRKNNEEINQKMEQDYMLNEERRAQTKKNFLLINEKKKLRFDDILEKFERLKKTKVFIIH